MKAKHIRKLRERIRGFKPFYVQKSSGLFGCFPRDGYITTIMSDSHENAIKRYVQREERMCKEMSEFRNCWYHETTYQWGSILVFDDRGFKKYYR